MSPDAESQAEGKRAHPQRWRSRGRSGRSESRWVWAGLVLLLCLAGLVRLWRLEAVPPGLTHDEAGHGQDALAILQGARPIYQTVGYGREPLYDYLLAGAMALGREPRSAMRLTAVGLGLSTLLLTFAWVQMAFDGPTALAAVALQAASFWSLSTSRQALRSGLLPVLFTAAVLVFWKILFARPEGCGPGRWGRALFLSLSLALLVGGTLYTYLPARVLWVVFPGFLLYLTWVHRPVHPRVWAPALVGLLLGLVLSVPLFVYLAAHPGAEQRLAMLDAPLKALRAGQLSVILDRAGECLAAFFVPGQGDTFLAYTIPGRPFFDPLTGGLFLVGVVLCVLRWRQPARLFALLWFLVGISPSLITGAAASITRSIAAMPVAFLFPALAVVNGIRWAAARWDRWAAWCGGFVFVALVGFTGVTAAWDYFVVWGSSPDVRAAYLHPLVEVADYLDGQPEGGVVGLSTVYPHAPHDPYAFDLCLQRQDLSLRWFDGRRALVLPAGQATVRLIAPASVPLDDTFTSLAGLSPRKRVALPADDLTPFFDVYNWDTQQSLADLAERGQGPPLVGMTLPVDFSGALHLAGYALSPLEAEPGGVIELITWWRVVDPSAVRPQDLSSAEQDLVFFTHALDEYGVVIGQEDRLDAPAWDWQAGDMVVQVHRVGLPDGAMAEAILLEVGVYRRADLARLPVVVDGVAVDDRVLLGPVEVVSR